MTLCEHRPRRDQVESEWLRRTKELFRGDCYSLRTLRNLYVIYIYTVLRKLQCRYGNWLHINQHHDQYHDTTSVEVGFHGGMFSFRSPRRPLSAVAITFPVISNWSVGAHVLISENFLWPCFYTLCYLWSHYPGLNSGYLLSVSRLSKFWSFITITSFFITSTVSVNYFLYNIAVSSS